MVRFICFGEPRTRSDGDLLWWPLEVADFDAASTVGVSVGAHVSNSRTTLRTGAVRVEGSSFCAHAPSLSTCGIRRSTRSVGLQSVGCFPGVVVGGRDVVIEPVSVVHSRNRADSRVLFTQDLVSRFFKRAAEAGPQPEGDFNPKNLSVPAETIAHWKEHILPEGDLTKVPGIDQANADLLMAAGIASIHMLTGEYLMQKGPDVDSFDSVGHHKKFFAWLGDDVGIVFHRSTIVHAIGEKMNLVFPGIYDPIDYDE